MDYVTGYAYDGERLRFERWAYDAWVSGTLRDSWLAGLFSRCYRFTTDY